MDAENLQKWKEEFHSERKKQASRVRGLQKETVMRRKAMEMKAQIEAAKEEKRRKEALAERKAQHMEATMRFQKGIKNFKLKKEKISLDDVLKQMSPARSRLNSADSERTRYQHSELAGYYCVNKKPASAVKRSSSFDSINMPKSAPGSYRLNNFNLEQFNSTAPSPNFRQAINDNQKQIHEMNREALKEFQNLIKNEVSSQNNNVGSYVSNFVYPIHQKFTNILPQSEIKKESETYSEVGTILTVEDGNSEDERDSLDTDSLLNARIESPNFARKTSDKKCGQDDVPIPIKTENNFNNYFNINLLNKVESPPPPPPPAHRPAISSQSSGNLVRKAPKQIKGILKRSASLDNTSLLISGVTKNANCFKSEKIIKDSIELANSRINSASNGESDSSRKKSVRFAHDQESVTTAESLKLGNNQDNSTSQVNASNANSNEASTRISSTNSIRRPIIKPRNTSQLKQQGVDQTLEHKNLINENSKPPLPNGQSGYSILNQKRREFFQRNRLLSDKQTPKSPKSTRSPSPTINQDTNSNFVFAQFEETKNNPSSDRIFRQVVYNFQDGRTKQSPSSNSNIQSRLNDTNCKELQINVLKNELELNLNDLSSANSSISKNQNINQQFVQKNQFQDKIVVLNGNDQYGFKRHFGFSPNSRQIQDNSASRLAYLNSIQKQSQYNTGPRIQSADNINRNQIQVNQLDMKYPLYSNFQTQNNQFSTRPIRQNFSQDQPQSAKEVLDSMALFLKAEDMSNRNYTESQIINTVQNASPKNATKQNMTSLSLEEQRIKSSLMRLDERYNFLKTHNQTRFNNEEMNGRRFNVMNKYQRPMSTNVIRYRK